VGRDWPATYVSSFVRSILAQPPAPAFRIRVVVDEDALALAAPLAELDTRVEIVPFRRGGASFNFAEKANFAVRTSGTDRVVLLNDDMEAIDGGWLAALLEPLELPGVGIVGGQMLRPDDTIQHCGIALGIHGAAAHLFEGLPSHHVAYNAFNQVMRNYAAVSGAMIAFRRAAFDRVGGFDERFPIDFNDVDFCLRLADAGLRTVYTPFARLRHFESRSARRLTQDALDRHRFCTRWASWVRRDPFYNRHLTRSGVMCEPATP
ncbi:glycosyltransferase, partial [Acidisphaera rubrifaciens]|uniref:glycosyltransferase n=1 Tax=Acidisphaera rubrifaciens TaxID=50715 RepID=UPI000662A87E